jgi:hypothetical protein
MDECMGAIESTREAYFITDPKHVVGLRTRERLTLTI